MVAGVIFFSYTQVMFKQQVSKYELIVYNHSNYQQLFGNMVIGTLGIFYFIFIGTNMEYFLKGSAVGFIVGFANNCLWYAFSTGKGGPSNAISNMAPFYHVFFASVFLDQVPTPI